MLKFKNSLVFLIEVICQEFTNYKYSLALLIVVLIKFFLQVSFILNQSYYYKMLRMGFQYLFVRNNKNVDLILQKF
jgi:hypothetical protein